MLTSGSQIGRRPTQSRVVGLALQEDGTPTMAYRALVEVGCGRCRGAIAPGALFSRQARPVPLGAGTGGVALTRQPVCTGCRPLRAVDTEGGGDGA